MHEGQRNSQTSRRTSDGPAMQERRVEQPDQRRPTRDEQATDHESNSQTRERRTMDDAETRLLYHRRLERFVEIVVNSH